MTTYRITRHFKVGRSIIIDWELTLEEAQEHCSRSDTHGEGWFDSYDEE